MGLALTVEISMESTSYVGVQVRKYHFKQGERKSSVRTFPALISAKVGMSPSLISSDAFITSGSRCMLRKASQPSFANRGESLGTYLATATIVPAFA